MYRSNGWKKMTINDSFGGQNLTCKTLQKLYWTRDQNCTFRAIYWMNCFSCFIGKLWTDIRAANTNWREISPDWTNQRKSSVALKHENINNRIGLQNNIQNWRCKKKKNWSSKYLNYYTLPKKLRTAFSQICQRKKLKWTFSIFNISLTMSEKKQSLTFFWRV